MSYYSDLDAAKALGREYAENGIAAGEFRPAESPLSGEWAGGPTVEDIARTLGVSDPSKLEDFELTDIADYWEDGYNSADWPVYGQVGDIVGYMYCAAEYSPEQWRAAYVERWIAGGVLAPAARDMRVEDILDQAAAYMGVDRSDEYSFDSDDFPKVILGE
jgi:hypothetical protein